MGLGFGAYVLKTPHAHVATDESMQFRVEVLEHLLNHISSSGSGAGG